MLNSFFIIITLRYRKNYTYTPQLEFIFSSKITTKIAKMQIYEYF